MPTPKVGTSMSGIYDSDVIAAIVEADKQEVVEDKIDPFVITKKHKFEDTPGSVKFSEVFWKPKDIPDIPLPMFKKEDWDPIAQLNIPEVDPCWVWNRPVTEKLAMAMYCGDTTLLYGMQGTGKSCLAEQWCALFLIPAWRMSCNIETREAHFLGSPGIDYNDKGQMSIKQEPTILTDSLTYGGMFIEDEAFRHNSALVLQSLREKNTRTVLLPDAPGRTAAERKLHAPKGRWFYILTDNTCGIGDETGIFDAQVQDASTLDRIDACIEVRYLKAADERKILKKHSTLSAAQISGILKFAKLVRKAFEQQTLLATFSVRALLAWAQKAQMCQDLELGLQLSWFDKLSSIDKATAGDIYNQVFARRIT